MQEFRTQDYFLTWFAEKVYVVVEKSIFSSSISIVGLRQGMDESEVGWLVGWLGGLVGCVVD